LGGYQTYQRRLSDLSAFLICPAAFAASLGSFLWVVCEVAGISVLILLRVAMFIVGRRALLLSAARRKPPLTTAVAILKI